MSEFTKTINNLVDLLLSRVRSSIGTTAPLYAQALADLNFALQELASLHSWKWMRKELSLTVPISTRILTPVSVASFPTDAVNYNKLSYSANGVDYDMSLVSEDELVQEFPDPTKTGYPSKYIIGPVYIASATSAPVRTIEVRPIFQVAVTLKMSYTYLFKNYAQADGAEVPPIPQNYYSSLVELAASRLLRFNKQPASEIADARTNALSFLGQLAKKDADVNKGTKAFRLNKEYADYRARRYE